MIVRLKLYILKEHFLNLSPPCNLTTFHTHYIFAGKVQHVCVCYSSMHLCLHSEVWLLCDICKLLWRYWFSWGWIICLLFKHWLRYGLLLPTCLHHCAASHAFVDMEDVAAGGAGMLHILASIYAERDQTARPDPDMEHRNKLKISLLYNTDITFWYYVVTHRKIPSEPQMSQVSRPFLYVVWVTTAVRQCGHTICPGASVGSRCAITMCVTVRETSALPWHTLKFYCEVFFHIV